MRASSSTLTSGDSQDLAEPLRYRKLRFGLPYELQSECTRLKQDASRLDRDPALRAKVSRWTWTLQAIDSLESQQCLQVLRAATNLRTFEAMSNFTAPAVLKPLVDVVGGYLVNLQTHISLGATLLRTWTYFERLTNLQTLFLVSSARETSVRPETMHAVRGLRLPNLTYLSWEFAQVTSRPLHAVLGILGRSDFGGLQMLRICIRDHVDEGLSSECHEALSIVLRTHNTIRSLSLEGNIVQSAALSMALMRPVTSLRRTIMSYWPFTAPDVVKLMGDNVTELRIVIESFHDQNVWALRSLIDNLCAYPALRQSLRRIIVEIRHRRYLRASTFRALGTESDTWKNPDVNSLLENLHAYATGLQAAGIALELFNEHGTAFTAGSAQVRTRVADSAVS
jgi:hypothetical protein